MSFRDLSGTPRRRQEHGWEYIVPSGVHLEICAVKTCATRPIRRIGLCAEHWHEAPEELKREIIEQGRA